MKTKIAGLLAAVLLAGSACARATPLKFSLFDGSNTVSFQVDSNPSSITDFGANIGFLINSVPVSVNGGPASPYVLGFYTPPNFGGLSIGPGGSLLSQDGPQLFAGTTAFPVFAPGSYALVDTSSVSSTFDRNFTLTITAVPEPGTLALFGLGLAGLGLSRRRETH